MTGRSNATAGELRVALIGFGNVGQGFTELLRDARDDTATAGGGGIRIVAISDPMKGSVHDPAGFEPATLLAAIERDGDLSSVPAADRGWDADATIARTEADVVVELSPTDLRTGEPAISHIRMAFAHGRHVVTTNKGPVVLAGPALAREATSAGVHLGVEGTVMSGTPCLALGRDLLQAAGIRSIRGILNGTTNHILGRMEAGRSYAAALGEAQAAGYAETDPTGDVEGFDAAAKVVILGRLVLGVNLTLADVRRTGITGVTAGDITAATEAGERWKLIGSVERTGDGTRAAVQPTRLPVTDPLAGVDGAGNAITFTTDALGDVTLRGPGAGRRATGYAILADLLAIQRSAMPTPALALR